MYFMEQKTVTESSFLIRARSSPKDRNGRLLISNSRPELEMTGIRNELSVYIYICTNTQFQDNQLIYRYAYVLASGGPGPVFGPTCKYVCIFVCMIFVDLYIVVYWF